MGFFITILVVAKKTCIPQNLLVFMYYIGCIDPVWHVGTGWTAGTKLTSWNSAYQPPAQPLEQAHFCCT